ncbi:MAG: DUF3047 domain-containing protein [Rhodanobacteraceae bacterium]
MKRTPPLMLLLLLCAFALSAAADTGAMLRFSDATQGTKLPPGWTPYGLSRHVPLARIAVVQDGDQNALRIDADAATGAITHPLDLPAATTLSWRWKVDHAVANADLSRKDGDDFAARVYVFFDLPESALSFGERFKLHLAQSVLGVDLPHAALCYVWDNHHPIGTIAPNAYYGGVRMIVLRSGNADAGRWQTQHRDLAADFRAALGRTAPRITGVALASDTDNTGGHATAWFGDLVFAPTIAADAKEPIR